MFAAAGTAVVPSSALWTGRFVCSGPDHLVHASSNSSYGNTAQTKVGFSCVDGSGSSKAAAILAIFGLQLVLGALVAYAVIVLASSAFRLRGSAEHY
jgi:hypothetical protein